MSNYTGMSIGDVQNLAVQLDASAGTIQDLMGQLTNALNTVPWQGPDRERLVGEWQSTHTVQLNTVITALRDAAVNARTNATQQEQASSA